MSSLDHFLKAELVKIARTKNASYADHLAKILEAKTTKYSSIEDALSDFASRLGIKESELDVLKTAALEKHAQLKDKNIQQLKDEGLLNPAAIEFMGRQKNKHTKDSPSPFAINKEKAKKIIDQLKQDRQAPMDTPGVETQSNEMGTAISGNLRLKLLIEKYAQKVLDLKPSMENIEKLRKELAGGEIETGYKISRYGFEFADIDGGFPKAGSSIKVTAYEFSFNKDRLVKEINNTLKKQLEEELSFEGWIKFIEEKVGEGILESKLGYDLIDRLSMLREQIFGSQEELLDPTKKKYNLNALKKIIKILPTSYQERILKMLAAGEYRHLLPEASGRLKTEVFPSSYKKSSFVMMSSFAPYLALALDPTKDQLRSLIKKVVELKKQNWTSLELEEELKNLGINYSKTSTTKESQKLPLHEKVMITVQNEENSNYKPLTLEKSPTSLEEQEKLLQGLHDQVFEAVRADLPLAYRPTTEGGHQALKLSDLEKGLDLTEESLTLDKDIKIENKNLGLHPIFKGKIEKKKPLGLGLLKETPKKEISKTEPPTLDIGLESTIAPTLEVESPKISPTFQDLLQKLKQKKSELKSFVKIAEAGLVVDDQGRSHTNLEEMKSSLLGEMVIEMKDEILDRVAKSLLPTITSTKMIEAPEEKLPLAAELKLKMIQKTCSDNGKIKIQKLLERFQK